MKVSKNILYGLFILAILFAQTLYALAEDDDQSAIAQHTIIGALTKNKAKSSSEKSQDIDLAQAKKVITVLEDKDKRNELINTLKTIVEVQGKIDKKNEQGVIASTRSLLGGFAERSLLSVQALLLSLWKVIDDGMVNFQNYTPLSIGLTIGLFFISLLGAISVEALVRRLSIDEKGKATQVDTLGGQIRFVLTQTTHFIAFCLSLYLINGLSVEFIEQVKPFGSELASLAILIRAMIKLRGMHLLAKNREISDILVLILVFFMVLFYVFLYLIHHSYLIHVGIYLFVLIGFYIALRLSIWRGHKKEIDHWLFFKISQTSYGHELYNTNDKLLKFFSGYFLILMVFVFLQIISGQYNGSISEYQLFTTCFLLLLTTLIILLAVYAKFGFLKLIDRYANPEMVNFYQQTLLSVTDIATFLVVIYLSKSITEVWFKNFLALTFHPEYQDYLRSLSKIVFYGIFSRFLWRFIDFLAMMNVAKKKEGKKTILPSQLRLTITPILKSVGHWLLIIFTVALILEELGVPIWPIIYSISVLGIAISLGAQSLVKDFINGILTLVEGNIAIGEVVTIGSHTGVVETLSLRGVALRHSSGALQTIPFSEVTNIINKSRDYTSVSVEIPVPFETRVQEVYQAFNRAFDDIRAHEIHGSRIMDKISISGVDRMADGAYYVSASIKIKPDPSNRFLKAFNEYLQIHLTKLGIKPPPMHGG